MNAVSRPLWLFLLLVVILSILSIPSRTSSPVLPEEKAGITAVTTGEAKIQNIVGSAPVASETVSASVPRLLPKMVDLGAGKCLACKEMVPVLEEAKKLYAGIAEVEFIDVWEKRGAGDKYAIRSIPTQIFFDREGKEVFRHEGFFPLVEIQKQFEALGAKMKNE